MTKNDVVIRKKLITQLSQEEKHKKIVYMTAQIGWGKTVFIKQYIEQIPGQAAYLTAKDKMFWQKLNCAIDDNIERIIIDDGQLLTADYDLLVDSIAKSYHKSRFYILSRSALPPALQPFYITGQLLDYDSDFFALKNDEIIKYGSMFGLNLNEGEALKINQVLNGWFLGLVVVVKHLRKEQSLTSAQNLGKLDVFDYFDAYLFRGFSPEVQNFLMMIGHLETFNSKMICMICGSTDVAAVLQETLKIGSFIQPLDPETYKIHQFFHQYLQAKQKRFWSPEKLKSIFENTALYFVLEQDVPNALKWYAAAGNNEKVAEILIKQTKIHPGNGYYYEIQDYYLSLPDEIVATSIELMSILSMIHSLNCHPELSEKYFAMLERYAKSLPKGTNDYKDAREQLLYLKITLPHRGIVNLIDIFKDFSLIVNKEGWNLQEMSITGNMPSLMNGGKDFCEWSKKDRFLYKTLKLPINVVLGKSAAGLAEIGLGESLFEKSDKENFTEELTLLNQGYAAARISGNGQLQFAAVAVMARIFLTEGKVATAIDLINQFSVLWKDNLHLSLNIKAFVCYLQMLNGDADYVETWFRDCAPNEYGHFWITNRYQYITKVKVYIFMGMYQEALALLKQLENYFVSYDRTYFYLDGLILQSIVLYRMGNSDWQQLWCSAVEKCEEYSFIRLITKYGIVVFDMANTCQPNVKPAYYKKLLNNIRKQAILYPKYLAVEKKKDFNLTESERKVLKLVCDGLSNAETAKLIGISERTVKFHLSNIYAKLDVKGRIEAINFCLENKLF